MTYIDIVPRQSIGAVRLGASRPDLPKEAKFQEELGDLGGVTFVLANGRVDDIWIEDLRTFPHEVRIAGQVLPKSGPLSEILTLLGPCEQVDAKGGVFFNCRSGLSIGTDFESKGTFIQLRIKSG